MITLLNTRMEQGYRTKPFPDAGLKMPDRLPGRPAWDPALCPADCNACGTACPFGAIVRDATGLALDLGKCVFCGECVRACPAHNLRFTTDYALAASCRADLMTHGGGLALARALEQKSLALFGRSLRLRQISAGGCNACEADTNVLNTLVFDLARFGIQFVASPRHADGVLITGPISANMKLAALKTYQAVPPPRLVIAVGACAIAGGPYAGHPETNQGIGDLLPVDLYIPGCPPHPYTILDGFLRLLGRL